jgi:hypothetical protein
LRFSLLTKPAIISVTLLKLSVVPVFEPEV